MTLPLPVDIALRSDESAPAASIRVVADEIDSSRALRSTADLTDLVGTVTAAGSQDETRWLEWKSTLDLGSPDMSTRPSSNRKVAYLPRITPVNRPKGARTPWAEVIGPHTSAATD
jgi:hypothetical protein